MSIDGWFGGNPTDLGSSLSFAKRREVASLIRTPRMPTAAGQRTDRRVLLGVDPGRDEPFELLARFVDHAERGVLRSRE